MTLQVFPSANNVGGGKALSEPNLRTTWAGDYNWAVYGLSLSLSGGVVTVTAGEAVMGGHLVRQSAPLATFDLAALGTNATRFIHLKVTCDGSGNVSDAQVIHEATCNWMAGSAPTVFWLCLGRVKTSGTAITEVVNAVHFPPHGQGFVGLATKAEDQTLNNCAAGSNYEVAYLFLWRVMAPRPCMMKIESMLHCHTDGDRNVYAGISDDDTPNTRLIGAVMRSEGAAHWMPFNIRGYKYMAAGETLSPRVHVNPSTGPADITIASGSYTNLAAWMMDNTAGL